MSILDKAESLTRRSSAPCSRRASRSRRNISRARSPRYFKPNGSIDPDDQAYVLGAPAKFRRLAARGRRPGRKADEPLARRVARIAVALADHPPRLRRGLELHRQMEGRRLATFLNAAGLQAAGALSSPSFAPTRWSRRSTAPGAITRSIDLVDAYHPQTILAYEMNDAPLKVANGAPLAAAGRAPARLQDGQIRHAHRGGRKLCRHRRRHKAATGKTRATSGTRGI